MRPNKETTYIRILLYTYCLYSLSLSLSRSLSLSLSFSLSLWRRRMCTVVRMELTGDVGSAQSPGELPSLLLLISAATYRWHPTYTMTLFYQNPTIILFEGGSIRRLSSQLRIHKSIIQIDIHASRIMQHASGITLNFVTLEAKRDKARESERE